MENSISGNLPKNGQKITDSVDALRDDTTRALTKAVSRVKSMGEQSIDAISEMTSQVRDVASNASDSIVTFTKKNPMTALAIAVAAGALLYAAINALTPSRD